LAESKILMTTRGGTASSRLKLLYNSTIGAQCNDYDVTQRRFFHVYDMIMMTIIRRIRRTYINIMFWRLVTSHVGG